MRERGVAQIRTEELGHPGWMRLARGFGIRVALGIALRRGEELLGILSVCRRTRAEPFTAAEERLGLALGQMATLAWENQELFEDLEETNRRKSEFVATVAHEFRNPLGAILGYAGMLAESDLGTEERAWVGRIERNARELLGIVNATLDLQRLERGQLPVEVREVRLPEILADVEASVLELAKGRAVRFELAVSGDLPPVHTDPTKLEIVLRNLATNAVKYTEEGSVRLEVERRDGGVEFRVVDTGPGIAPEDLRRIFDPFFRGRRGKGAGGVGLGLFIVQRLVALLGGEVSVRSVPGEGTTFRLWIPESLEPRSGLAGAEGSQG
ncbi:MAG: hypothetical protein KatS3mg076_0206 [Candidatus Binatia bacterium]|nr:MAG: hypothetical protein KatS3mg076_0206 [Candidatus Binatia bacterium]